MKKLTIGVLMFDEMQPLDFIGPWEVLATWTSLPESNIELISIAPKNKPVQCINQVTLSPHTDIAHCPDLDALVLTGGTGVQTLVHDKEWMSFILEKAQQAEHIISICTGAFFLEKLGLLDGQKATTYWRAIPELEKNSNIEIVEERIVRDGNLWVSGGVTSGIDIALAFISDFAGEEKAGEVQLLLEYFPDNPGFAQKADISKLPDYYLDSATDELPGYIEKQ